MSGKKLTDPFLRGLEARPSRYEIADTLAKGLYVAVEKTGTKVFAHRFSVASKGARLVLGRYPALSLAQARDTVRAQRIQLEKGCDPRQEKSTETSSGPTMEALCIAFLESRLSCTRKVTWSYYARQIGLKYNEKGSFVRKNHIKDNILTMWGDRPAASITKSEITEFLREISGGRKLAQADSIYGILKRMYRWAIKKELVAVSPVELLDAPLPRKPRRQRLLSPHEIACIWAAAGKLGDPDALYNPERDSVRWLILTGARKQQALWMEFRDFDPRENLWLISAEKPGSKKVPNSLPITREMQAMLDSCPHKSGYIFSEDGGKTPFDLGDLTMRRLRRLLKKDGHNFERWVLHDFRRIYRTTLSSFGIPEGDKVCELLIGHTLPGVEPIYNLYRYLNEKRFGLENWAIWLREKIEAEKFQYQSERLAA